MRTLGSKGGCGCRRMEKENVLRETRAYEYTGISFIKLTRLNSGSVSSMKLSVSVPRCIIH